MRNYEKAARMQEVADLCGPEVLAYGEDVRVNFSRFCIAGVQGHMLIVRRLTLALVMGLLELRALTQAKYE